MRQPESVCELGGPLPGELTKLADALEAGTLCWQGMALSVLGGYRGDAVIECAPFTKAYSEESEAPYWKASRWIGTLSHQGQSVRITPRIGMARFYRLAEMAFSAAAVTGATALSAQPVAQLQDLLPLAWWSAWRSALLRCGAPPKSYVRRQETDCDSVLGQLDLVCQMVKNRVSKQKLACTWDDLTFDNPLNQATILVIKHLRKHRCFPFSNSANPIQRELLHWLDSLSLVGVTSPVEFPCQKMRWSRGNEAFGTAHQLASQIIHGRGVALRGHQIQHGIFIDSAEVWELYLWKAIERVLARRFSHLRVNWPRKGNAMKCLLIWKGQSIGGLIPDFEISRRDNNQVIAILDAKYRVFNNKAENLKELATQMAIYCFTANESKAPGTPWPVSVLLLPVAEKESGAPGINQRYKAGEIGSGAFQVPGEPAFLAWAIKLGDASAAAAFHESIEAQIGVMVERVVQSVAKT